jgi:hypothetical protein
MRRGSLINYKTLCRIKRALPPIDSKNISNDVRGKSREH